jgi:hypothetical protein
LNERLIPGSSVNGGDPQGDIITDMETKPPHQQPNNEGNFNASTTAMTSNHNADNTNYSNSHQPTEHVLDFDSLDLDDLMNSINNATLPRKCDDDSVDFTHEFNQLDAAPRPFHPNHHLVHCLATLLVHHRLPTFVTSHISTSNHQMPTTSYNRAQPPFSRNSVSVEWSSTN